MASGRGPEGSRGKPAAIYHVSDQSEVYWRFVAVKKIPGQEKEVAELKQTAVGVEAISPPGTKRDSRLADCQPRGHRTPRTQNIPKGLGQTNHISSPQPQAT